MWVCFLPSDDKVQCENQLELLESSNYFYCADLLGAGQCIKTIQLFGFSKAAIVVHADRFVGIFWVFSVYFRKWMRMKFCLFDGVINGLMVIKFL